MRHFKDGNTFLRKSEYYCLLEAMRRMQTFHPSESTQVAWVGFGTPSGYREAVESGLMVCATQLNGKYNTWWRLTATGASIVEYWMKGVPALQYIPTKEIKLA